MNIICPRCNGSTTINTCCKHLCKTIYCACGGQYHIKNGIALPGHDTQCHPRPPPPEPVRIVRPYNA